MLQNPHSCMTARTEQIAHMEAAISMTVLNESDCNMNIYLKSSLISHVFVATESVLPGPQIIQKAVNVMHDFESKE